MKVAVSLLLVIGLVGCVSAERQFRDKAAYELGCWGHGGDLQLKVLEKRSDCSSSDEIACATKVQVDGCNKTSTFARNVDDKLWVRTSESAANP